MFNRKVHDKLDKVLKFLLESLSETDRIKNTLSRMEKGGYSMGNSNIPKAQDAVVERLMDLQSKQDALDKKLMAVIAELERFKSTTTVEDANMITEALKIKVDRPAFERANAILQERVIALEKTLDDIREVFSEKDNNQWRV